MTEYPIRFERVGPRPENGWYALYRGPFDEEHRMICSIVGESGSWRVEEWSSQGKSAPPFKTRQDAARLYLEKTIQHGGERRRRKVFEEWSKMRRIYLGTLRSKIQDPDISNRVYTILVTTCGASESERKDFVHAMQRTEQLCQEWRFRGMIGFGGKFYCSDLWCVGCYPEEEGPDSVTRIAEANEQLIAFAKELMSTSEERHEIAQKLARPDSEDTLLERERCIQIVEDRIAVLENAINPKAPTSPNANRCRGAIENLKMVLDSISSGASQA